MRRENYKARNWPARFWAKVNIGLPDACWEWKSTLYPTGYGAIQHEGKTKYAHRVGYELHNNSLIPPGFLVMHSCDNRACINPAHLRLGTPQDNTIDMFSKNRGYRAQGVKHHNAKLNDEMVTRIRQDPRSHSLVASELGLHKSTIRLIRLGVSWAHVPLA